MTLRERLKAVANNFAGEQDWNIQEYAVHKRDIDYRRGKADAYRDVVHRLDEVLEEFPEEPVRNPDKLTLTELAREMRKLFEFDYVTVDANESITFWVRKPLYISMCGLWDRNAYLDSWDIFNIDFSSAVNLDLSEYKDADGNIDYSKCIVEVE